MGHHYPSDLIAGALLGTTLGAASYEVLQTGSHWVVRLRWLLWLQIAIVFLVTQMAYLHILPGSLLSWPFADKVLHFLLFGAVTFWLNLWMDGRILRFGPWTILLALLIPISIAAGEEGLQVLSPLRTASLFDLMSDLARMFCAWWLSDSVLRASNRTINPHTVDKNTH